MPATSPPRAFQSLESLESRRLLASTIDITRFGAVPNDGLDDSGPIQSAVRAAAPGDIVMIPAGTFEANNAIELPSGVTLRGVGGTVDTDIRIPGLPRFLLSPSKLKLNVRGGYGLRLGNNASGVTISDLDITSAGGAVSGFSGRVSNISIVRNAFSAHGMHTMRINYATFLNVSDNYFHHSDGADRSFEGWDINQASFNRNIMYSVNQGIHIMEVKDNVQVTYNVMRRIHRMGIEIQGQVAYSNLLVQGNVFYDAMRPYWDTFALSVPANNGTNLRIIGNYLRSDFTGSWGTDGQPRFGYAIEVGGNGNGDFTKRSMVSGNIMGGPNPWFNFVVSCTVGSRVTGNFIYGNGLIGDFAGEPGDRGQGTVDVGVNTIDRDWTHMPPVPAWVNGGIPPGPEGGDSGIGGDNPYDGSGDTGDDGGDTNLGPPPTGIAPTLTAFVNSGSMISLSWGDTYTDETGYIIERSKTGMVGTFVPIWDSKAPNITKYEDRGLPTGTKLYYRVVAYRDLTSGRYSNIAAATTKGPPAGGSGGGAPGGSGGFNTSSFSGARSVLPRIPGIDDDRSIFSDTLL